MAMDARGWNELGQAIEELEGWEAKHFVAVRIGFGAPIHQASVRGGERLETGGGDRQHRRDDTPVLWWRPTTGERYGKGLGHARPYPNPPEIREPRHGWISHVCIPEREIKQKAGWEGPITRLERANALRLTCAARPVVANHFALPRQVQAPVRAL